MNKITFKDLPDTSTPLTADNLNTMQDNVEDAINNSNYVYKYTLNIASASLTASTWNAGVHNEITTDTLPIGTYLIFTNSANMSASSNGVCTANLMVDDSDTSRQTFPLATVMSSNQILCMSTFESETTHTINIRYYPNVSCTASSSQTLYLIKIM